MTLRDAAFVVNAVAAFTFCVGLLPTQFGAIYSPIQLGGIGSVILLIGLLFYFLISRSYMEMVARSAASFSLCMSIVLPVSVIGFAIKGTLSIFSEIAAILLLSAIAFFSVAILVSWRFRVS